MKFLIKAHYIIGIVFLSVFLLTGVYMHFSFPELYNGREEVRMMYRATHIYILVGSLVNLMAGNYLTHYAHVRFKKLTRLASILSLITPPMFFVAFIVEPADYLIGRPVSFWAVVFLFGGVMLHTLVNIEWLNKYAN